jgi:AcrR family transcriptional regulator
MGEETQQLILDAALAEFAHHGFQKTTLKDIAAQAGFSRPTVYSFFQNKDQIFRSVSIDIHEKGLREASALLQDPSLRDVTDAVSSALYARHGKFLHLALETKGAAEMEDENGRLCGDVVVSTQKTFNELLAQYINMAEAAKRIRLSDQDLSAEQLVTLLNLSVIGCKRACTSSVEYKARIVRLVTLFFGGLIV